MSFIDKILGGGIAKAAEGIAGVVDKFITTPDVAVPIGRSRWFFAIVSYLKAAMPP